MVEYAASSWSERRLLARASPGGLAVLTNKEFKLPPHLDLLDKRLVSFVSEVARKSEFPGVQRLPGEDRTGPRLMVFMPPRHGKSLLTSIYTTAWTLGCFPTMRVMVTSYQSGLPAGWGRKARDLLDEVGPDLYQVGMNPSSKAAGEWETDRGGGFMARGIGGGITGRGAELLIIDDPVKDQEAAMSLRIRDKAWDWWLSTAKPRLQPGAGVIVIMTRWHEDDLAGRMLRQDRDEGSDGEGWEVISFPALAEYPEAEDGTPVVLPEGEEVDDLGRRFGDPLWPAMFGRDYLEKTRRTSTTYWFTAMYQQRPGPSEGAMIKREWLWENLYDIDHLPQVDEVVQSWDLTFKESTGGSYVVGQLWVGNQADRYLGGQIRARLDFTDTLTAIKAMTLFVSSRGYAKPGQHRILVEKAANGEAVMNVLKKTLQGMVGVSAKETKQARLAAVTPQFEAGNVHLPRGVIPAPPGYEPTKTEEYIEELVTFPVAMFDDQVDATSQALVRMGKQARGQQRIRSGGYDRKR